MAVHRCCTKVNLCAYLNGVAVMVVLGGVFTNAHIMMKVMLMIIPPPQQFQLIRRDCNIVGGCRSCDAGVVVYNNAVSIGLGVQQRQNDEGIIDVSTQQPRIMQLKPGSGLEYWHEGGLRIGTFMNLNSLAPSLRVMPSERRKKGRDDDNMAIVIDVGQIVGIWEDQGPKNMTTWTNLLDSVNHIMHEIDPLNLNLDDLWKATANVSKRGRWVVGYVCSLSASSTATSTDSIDDGYIVSGEMLIPEA